MANTTFDPATIAAVTLSAGNLVATNTGTTSTNQGAHAPFADGRSVGKFYFEIKLTTFTGGAGVGVGVGTTAATYTGLSSGTLGDMCFAVGHTGSGVIVAPGGNTGFTIGARTTGDVIGVAVDLTNRRVWFRLSPTGLWDGNGSHDPTVTPGTGGGLGIPAGTIVPFVTFGSHVFGGAAGVAGNVFTANFGDSAFVGAVPAGYIAGWPVPAASTPISSYALSASRAGVGSVVVTTTSASITAQIVGVGVVAMPVAAPPPTARQYGVTVNTS